MAARDSIQLLSGVTGALGRFLRRLIGRMLLEGSSAANPLAGPDDPDAYTLFEGTTLRLHQLSVEPLENLRDDPSLLSGAFRIRVARTQDAREGAGSLVRRRYASRGYQVSSAKAVDPNLFTFVAYNSGDLIGTVGLRLDSPRGLSADELYKVEVDALRQRGLRVCEFTRLAIDENAAIQARTGGIISHGLHIRLSRARMRLHRDRGESSTRGVLQARARIRGDWSRAS